jgi:hypothetical protein
MKRLADALLKVMPRSRRGTTSRGLTVSPPPEGGKQ